MSESVPLRLIEQEGNLGDGIVAESPAMRGLIEKVDRVARSEIPVLLHGETGSGKEVVARLIHGCSGRRGPFVALNCAAMPTTLAESELFGHVRGAFTGADRATTGVFEQAHGGTLLLDEIGELDLAVQAKLLRVLEDGCVRSVGGDRLIRCRSRIIAATHRQLEVAASDGRFRDDLYHRLAGVTLLVPPLRERPEDIPQLVARFLREEAPEPGQVELGPETLDFIAQQRWPGNVRELRLAVRRAVLLGGPVLGPSDFATAPLVRPANADLDAPDGWLEGRTWADIERGVLAWAVARYGGASAAARALDCPRSTVHDRVRRLGIGASRRPPRGLAPAAATR